MKLFKFFVTSMTMLNMILIIMRISSAWLANESVKNAILGLAHLGQTRNTPEGFRVTREQCFTAANGDRPDVQNLCIFISDGVPFPADRRDPAIREAESLKNAGVLMIAVGVIDAIDRNLLVAISSPPQVDGSSYFLAADFTALTLINVDVGTRMSEVIESKSEFWQRVKLLTLWIFVLQLRYKLHPKLCDQCKFAFCHWPCLRWWYWCLEWTVLHQRILCPLACPFCRTQTDVLLDEHGSKVPV